MASGSGFPDRREILFGRAPDLAQLIERAQFKGLTAVAARPQMGKSWLLTELARALSQDHNPPYLVGFTESFGETSDLFLRAVVDLYTRWLSDASYGQQARMVWDQQKGNFVTNVGKAVGSVFQKISTVGGIAGAPVGTVVKEAFDRLAAANQTLTSGGVQIPALQYDQARDLVQIVAAISGKRIAIILDQWEQSPSADFEAKTLNAFLRHLHDWPLCHLFIALRRDDPAFGLAKELRASHPGTAELYELGLMHLDEAGTQHGLLGYLRQKVPATQAVPDGELLPVIDGYPGTIYQWTSDYQVARMKSRGDLESVAADAQAYRFNELKTLLKDLPSEERKLAIRLVLHRNYRSLGRCERSDSGWAE